LFALITISLFFVNFITILFVFYNLNQHNGMVLIIERSLNLELNQLS
jgi:hypothetical protein